MSFWEKITRIVQQGRGPWDMGDRLLLDNKLYGWKDNFANLTAAEVGAGAPTMTAFGPSGTVKQRSFIVNDSVYIVWHIDHDVAPGSTAYMHMHWATNGTSTNTVKWQISYTYAKGHQQEAFPTDTVLSLEAAPTATAWQHEITEDTTGFVIPEVDSLIVAEVKRVTNGGTDNTDTVFGLFADIHYLSDRSCTPSRSPDFYTGD